MKDGRARRLGKPSKEIPDSTWGRGSEKAPRGRGVTSSLCHFLIPYVFNLQYWGSGQQKKIQEGHALSIHPTDYETTTGECFLRERVSGGTWERDQPSGVCLGVGCRG